ncbi:serine protease, partial [Vibrio makurazakiensis]|uniref:S1 family peptidase n=1 Tax=Vibrio makurazakiensis TaxID=2910250 RepID=UPI003D0A3A82
GSDAPVSTYRSIANLFVDSIEYDGVYYPEPYCGATILDPQHILTAAHCIYGSNALQLFTTVVPQLGDSSDYPSGNIQRVRVSEIYYRNDYSNDISDLLPNDIAILKLESSLNIDSVNDVIVRPSSESYRADNVNTSYKAVGHGNTSTGSDTTTNLLQTDLNLIDNTTCKGYFTEGSKMTDSQICFDGNYSASTGLNGGTCQGDSGGPAYWYDGSQYVQVGITSFGPSTCGYTGGVTSVFTEIYDYRTWIDSVLAGSETPQRTVTGSDRQTYLDTYGRILLSGSNTLTTNDASGSSGGSLSFLGLGFLALIGRFRKASVTR